MNLKLIHQGLRAARTELSHQSTSSRSGMGTGAIHYGIMGFYGPSTKSAVATIHAPLLIVDITPEDGIVLAILISGTPVRTCACTYTYFFCIFLLGQAHVDSDGFCLDAKFVYDVVTTLNSPDSPTCVRLLFLRRWFIFKDLLLAVQQLIFISRQICRKQKRNSEIQPRTILHYIGSRCPQLYKHIVTMNI
jgi:hypothetical protein